jgi:hypothetical protein
MPNFVLGAGKVYFARLASGVLGGEKLIQETPSFSYSVSSERVQEYSSDGPTAELVVDVPTKVTREGKFSCRDISDYNLALFTLAATATQTTSAAAVTSDPINGGVALAADTYYQLGLAAKPHVGVRAITSFVLDGAGGTPISASSGANYTVDLATGRLYIPAGSAAIGVICTADYNTTAVSWGEVQSSDDGAAEGAIRFVSDNTTGVDRDFYFPSVTIGGDGDNALKSRDSIQELGFSFSIKRPTTGSAVYIDGRAT